MGLMDSSRITSHNFCEMFQLQPFVCFFKILFVGCLLFLSFGVSNILCIQVFCHLRFKKSLFYPEAMKVYLPTCIF